MTATVGGISSTVQFVSRNGETAIIVVPGNLNWDEYNTVLKQHPLVRPQIKIPYARLTSYVRL